MSTHDTVERPVGWMHGKAALSIPGVMGAFTLLTAIGNLRMEVPGDADFPGPTFFPWILVVAGGLMTVLLTVHYLRHPDPHADGDGYPTYTDWQMVGWVVGGFLAFSALLEVLGWILAAALLFWSVARAFGSTRALFDLSAGLLASSGIYLIFAVVLGLPLPSGLLGGI